MAKFRPPRLSESKPPTSVIISLRDDAETRRSHGYQINLLSLSTPPGLAPAHSARASAANYRGFISACRRDDLVGAFSAFSALLFDKSLSSDLPSPLLRSLRANGSRISRSADRLDPRNPLIYRWEMRKGSMRLCLIPISDRVVIVRSVIGMTVLDGGF
jgi:hypothetical protein